MSRSTRRLPGMLAALTLGALCGTAFAGGRPDKVLAELQEPHRHHVAAELLVQFEAGLGAQAYGDALARVGGRFVERVSGDLHRIALPAGADLSSAIRTLHATPGIDFAEPNWLYYADSVSDDTYYTTNRLWGMEGDTSPLFRNQYGSQAAEAWDKGHTDCGKVMVAIIDEGAQYKHPDLKHNYWENPAEIPDNGIDDDGNGFIDDTHGWDFARDDKTNYDGLGDDHGTHVSGTIGARGGNTKGVAGMCWKLRLINVKFLGNRSGSTANAIKSIDYVTDLKLRHKLDLVAINASWGGGGYSQGLKKSIEAAGKADIVFVAAAGNDGANNDVSPHYPSSYDSPTIISVAAIGSAGALASFSNYGATTVDLGAPGVAVYSTVPAGTGYAAYSGTSMATPHVAGAIALYASSHPGLSANALKEAILATTVPTPSLNGKTLTGGRLDASSY
jgi:subtilisin family serine protease